MVETNSWKHMYTTYIIEYCWIDGRKWSQTSGLYAFNNKLCIESLFYKYSSMHIVRYPPSTPKKRGWGYTYALMVEKHCWSKVHGSICQGG